MATDDDYNAEHDPAFVGSAEVERLKEEFETKEDPVSEDSEKIKDVLSALLTVGAVAAYCSGPAGSVIGSALSTGAGIVSALKKPQSDESELNRAIKSMETMQRNEKVRKQLTAIEAYWKWLKINRSTLESKESEQRASMKTILATLDNNWTDPSHELFLSTNPHHTGVMWEKSASRLAAAACVSCLISAHSLRCHIFAWLALDSKARGKQEEYKEHRSSFKTACGVMQNTADEKRKEMNKLIETAMEQRADLVQGPTFDFKCQKWPEGYQRPGHWLNQRTDGNSTPCWFIEDRHTGKYGTWRQQGFLPTAFMNKWIIRRETEPPKAAKDEVFYMKVRARKHVGLSAHPTRVVMQSWNDACQIVPSYIIPHMKKDHAPPIIRSEVVHDPHPWIRDASTVSFAYKLRTENGTSELSKWSDPIDIQSPAADGSMNLPVLRLDDFGFRTITQRVVYHRKTARATGKKDGEDELVQARVVDDNIFVDTMPDF
ncbi:hypothetical protein F5Y18DRAFT_408994 [Xylariaceae sp. FL1019]|nr:hypothetical protein F5Y18DRAFT_408994 [Xylariaceae sp. FL1019]